MKNICVAFELFDGEVSNIPPGYKEINFQLIFNKNMGEKFKSKARMVAGGHNTDVPSILTYSSILSRDSICIDFTVKYLNNLKVIGRDIQNAYLTALPHEKSMYYSRC